MWTMQPLTQYEKPMDGTSQIPSSVSLHPGTLTNQWGIVEATSPSQPIVHPEPRWGPVTHEAPGVAPGARSPVPSIAVGGSHLAARASSVLLYRYHVSRWHEPLYPRSRASRISLHSEQGLANPFNPTCGWAFTPTAAARPGYARDPGGGPGYIYPGLFSGYYLSLDFSR